MNIVYQGEPGAYSHLAAREHFPEHEAVSCETFGECFAQVRSGRAELAMLPVENSLAGRVSDIHRLLPDGGLHIVGERFQPIHHQLLAVPGVTVDTLETVRSHPMALGQVREYLKELGVRAVADADTAGAARRVAERGDPRVGAVASRLAAETYGLRILAEDIEDAGHNTTRFLVLARDAVGVGVDEPAVTSLVFRTRNVPSALYKALGGFATNGLNLSKLESYMVGGEMRATQFHVDVEGHPESEAMAHALEELGFWAEVTVLGTYQADASRGLLG